MPPASGCQSPPVTSGCQSTPALWRCQGPPDLLGCQSPPGLSGSQPAVLGSTVLTALLSGLGKHFFLHSYLLMFIFHDFLKILPHLFFPAVPGWILPLAALCRQCLPAAALFSFINSNWF